MREENEKINNPTAAELRKEYERLVAEEYNEIIKDAPAVYARHLTAQEMRELIAFYRTPAGAKTLRVMPQATLELTAKRLERMQGLQEKVYLAFLNVLQKRGSTRINLTRANMRSHIAVASGAVLGAIISFQAFAQNANQSGMNAASSNANSGGPALTNSNSPGTSVDMGIVRQGLLGIVPAVAPYQEYSPGPHITNPDPASLTMATIGASLNAVGQAMLPPDAKPWQRAVVAGISGVLSSAREGVGPSMITGLYGAATSLMGSAADFVTKPPDWNSLRQPTPGQHSLRPTRNSPAYDNAQIAINAGLAGLGTAGVTGVAAWLTDMAIVPVIEGTAIIANAPVLIPTVVIAGGIAFIGTVIDKKLDLPPFLYSDPQGVPGNTASNSNQNFGDQPPVSNTDANTNTSNLAGGPETTLEPTPICHRHRRPTLSRFPCRSGSKRRSRSRRRKTAIPPIPLQTPIRLPDSRPETRQGQTQIAAPLPAGQMKRAFRSRPPSLEPSGTQTGLRKPPPRYGDPGEGGMGPAASRWPATDGPVAVARRHFEDLEDRWAVRMAAPGSASVGAPAHPGAAIAAAGNTAHGDDATAATRRNARIRAARCGGSVPAYGRADALLQGGLFGGEPDRLHRRRRALLRRRQQR